MQYSSIYQNIYDKTRSKHLRDTQMCMLTPVQVFLPPNDFQICQSKYRSNSMNGHPAKLADAEDGARTNGRRGTHGVGGKVMGYGEDGVDGEERRSPKSLTGSSSVDQRKARERDLTTYHA